MIHVLAGHAGDVQLILLPPRDLDQRFAVTVPSNVVPFPPGSRTDASEGEQADRVRVEGTLSDILPHIAAQLPTLRHLLRFRADLQ